MIEFEFNFKLPIIGLLLIFRLDEKLHDVILGEQGSTQDSHDLHDRAPMREVVFNDYDETVCDDGNLNLDTHSIVTLSPEKLDPKMLLDPFEEVMQSFS